MGDLWELAAKFGPLLLAVVFAIWAMPLLLRDITMASGPQVRAVLKRPETPGGKYTLTISNPSPDMVAINHWQLVRRKQGLFGDAGGCLQESGVGDPVWTIAPRDSRTVTLDDDGHVVGGATRGSKEELFLKVFLTDHKLPRWIMV